MRKTRKLIPDRVTKGDVSVPERLRHIDKTQPYAVLATDAEGQPYTSLIAYALTSDLKGFLFTTPKSTRKYRNILNNRRVSLLIDTRSNTGRDYLQAEALTILGRAYLLRQGGKWETFSGIFLKKHPVLKDIMNSSEIALVYVAIKQCIHATRFQSVTVWNPKDS